MQTVALCISVYCINLAGSLKPAIIKASYNVVWRLPCFVAVSQEIKIVKIPLRLTLVGLGIRRSFFMVSIDIQEKILG